MISVVIVSYNTRELLRACLNSLRRFEAHAEVIVVDNASRDGSAELVRGEFPEVKFIALPRNAGFAHANNAGLEFATRPYVVLLNSDTELSDASLSRCVARLELEPELGAVHPRLVGADGQPQQSEHRFPTLAAVARRTIRLKNQADSHFEKTWLAGTALVIRRKALDSIGGRLENAYFIYWEDADLSARLRNAGWGLAIEPSAVVKHYGGASGGGPDAARREDLFAWYCHGKHRWFRRNRPRWESAALWLLDAADLPRKLLRGLRHSRRRRAEWAHSRVMARVLALTLLGRSPATITQ